MSKIVLCGIRYPRYTSITSHFNQLRSRSSENQNNDNIPQNAPDKKEPKNKEALDKLNLLLKQIIEEDAVSSLSKLELAKPKPKRVSKEKKEFKTDNVERHTVGKDVITSVQNVAQSLGGDLKQTESELLSKLLNSVHAKPDTTPFASNLSDIVKGMKIDRSTKTPESLSRAQQIKSILKSPRQSFDDPNQARFTKVRRPRTENQLDTREKERVNLFGAAPLGIFSDVNEYSNVEINKTWEKLHQRDLKLAITHPPSNYFQQMILWTEQGKLWQFPIDNEQGMEEEQNVYFAEHIFLEKYLEPWCPPKGPIRHFMELVCVGLSKNPYISAERKQEHIAWYRDYFQDKQKLLEEVGAIPSASKQSDAKGNIKS